MILNEILSKIPTEKGGNTDLEILRLGILAEIDAVNLYEQFAQISTNEIVKKTMLEIAKEEKTHIAEFETLLLQLDPEQRKEMEKGKEEVESKEMKEMKERFYGKTSIQKLEEMKKLFKKIN